MVSQSDSTPFGLDKHPEEKGLYHFPLGDLPSLRVNDNYVKIFTGRTEP